MGGELETRITLVDDDDADIYIFRRALRKADIATDIAVFKDGQSFVDHFAGRTRDADPGASREVALVDINMPRMNGFDALRALRDLGWRQSPPVIMFSTSQEQRDVDLAYSLGASGFVSKPASVEDAERLVRALSDYWLGANIR